MIKVAIVDDEKSCSNSLEKILLKYQEENDVLFKIEKFSYAIDFVSDYGSNFDLVLLDIDMPHMDGLEAAKKLRQVDNSVQIIFVTNLEQYAIKGYEVDALSYLIKPVTYKSFSLILDKFVSGYNKRNGRYLTIEQKSGVKRIFLRNIYYIKVLGRYVELYTDAGAVEMHVSMKELEKDLVGTSFVRIDNSAMVNKEYVTEVNREGAIVNGTLIPCSRSKRSTLLDAFTRYFR